MKENILSSRQIRLFFSYFLVFLIPAALVAGAVFQISDKIIREELQSNHTMQVSTASYNLQSALDAFSMLATSAAYSGFGDPVNLEEDVSAATDLISLLGRTSLSYGFVSDVFMIYRDSPYIYSGQTSFTRENFTKYLHFANMESRQALDMIGVLDAPACFPIAGINDNLGSAPNQGSFLLLCFPCTRREYTAGMMGFLIDVDRLNLFLGNTSDENWLYLTDGEENILNPSAGHERLPDAFPGLTETQKTGRDLSLHSRTDGDYTYTFGAVLPGMIELVGVSDSRSALGKLFHFRNLFLLLLCGLFLLGTLFVFFVWRRKKSELESLTASYERQLKEVVPLKQREILYSLIDGVYLYENDFTIQCEETMMDFNAARHYCLLLPPDAQPDMELLLAEASGFHVTLAYSYYIYKTEEFSVWLAGTQEELPDGPRDITGAQIFVSRPVLRILDIHSAYSDVLSRKYMQDSQAAAKELSTENDRIRQEHYDRLLNRISDKLSAADKSGIVNWADGFLADMEKDRLSFAMRQRLLLQLFILCPNTADLPFSIPDILKMDQDAQLTEAFTTLFAFCENKSAPAETDGETSLDAGQIMSYIRENYTDPSFSLQVLADHFQVSNSYLSWFFKQKQGITILDYTTQLKMDLATKLLQQGLNLQQVSLQVGYLNVSSFIRRFKQTMGMTPGEYKKEMASR